MSGVLMEMMQSVRDTGIQLLTDSDLAKKGSIPDE